MSTSAKTGFRCLVFKYSNSSTAICRRIVWLFIRNSSMSGLFCNCSIHRWTSSTLTIGRLILWVVFGVFFFFGEVACFYCFFVMLLFEMTGYCGSFVVVGCQTLSRQIRTLPDRIHRVKPLLVVIAPAPFRARQSVPISFLKLARILEHTIGNVISNNHVRSEENAISPCTHFFQTNLFFHDKYE